MNKLKVLDSKRQQWKRTAYSFISNSSGTNEAEDIVQDTYLKLHTSGRIDAVVNDEGEINSSYMYLSIRSVATDYLRINQKETKRKTDIDDAMFELEDSLSGEYSERFRVMVDKMNAEVETWLWYDKQLFKIYKNTGYSMQKLSDETKISKTSIFTTIKRCKDRLREVLGEDYQEYMNGI